MIEEKELENIFFPKKISLNYSRQYKRAQNLP